MTFDPDMAEIAQLFIDESREGLDLMEEGLLNLTLGDADPDTLNAIFRAAHSIKGGGATFGFMEISSFAHHVETLLDDIRREKCAVTSEGVDLMLASVDCLRDMIACLGQGEIDTQRAAELEVALEAMLAHGSSSDAPRTANGESALPEPGKRQARTWEIEFRPHENMLRQGHDPLQCFRALETLGTLTLRCEGTEHLTLGEFDPTGCYLHWYLLLVGQISRSDIAEVFAPIEQLCDITINELSEDGEVLASQSSPQIPTAPTRSVNRAKGGPQDSGSIRVNVDKVDALINLVGELVITQSMLSRFSGDFDFTQINALRDGLAQLSRNTRELQDSVMAIRMLPISVAFSRFPRLVRDTGNAFNKQVELRVTGEHTELDKTVLEKIGDPLVHLVRNSLDHGLETPQERLAAGKPEMGVLELKAFHEGGNIVIQVIDDGAGIDQDRVLTKAREKGLVGDEETLSDDRINNLIFVPGFSTAEQVSDLSGRGVGMDVVRRNVSDLGGSVFVESEAGLGSTFTIRLPLTLAILDGQLVRVGSESYVIPLVSIVETIQVSGKGVTAVAGQSELFKLRDEYLPILRLHDVFGVDADSHAIDDGLLVVVEANGQRVGIFVDDLLEQQQVVIKSLETNYRQMRGISGATILGDGTVALIIDIPGLIELFFERHAHEPAHAVFDVA